MLATLNASYTVDSSYTKNWAPICHDLKSNAKTTNTDSEISMGPLDIRLFPRSKTILLSKKSYSETMSDSCLQQPA